MNKELLRKLTFQAAAQVNPLLIGSEWQMVYNEKFAELIVKECAGVCFTNWRDNGDSYGHLIQEHFGV